MFEAHLRLIGVLPKGTQSKVAGIYSWKMKGIHGGYRAGQPLLNLTPDSLHQKWKLEGGKKIISSLVMFYLVFSPEMLMWAPFLKS